MDAIVTKIEPAGEPATKGKRPSREEAEAAVQTLLRWIGDDPDREGLLDTPARVVKAYEELYSGYGKSAADLLGRTFDEVAGYDDIVLLRDIPFHTHCEHHMVPVVGKAHVAYLPNGTVLGLSKIIRVVEIFARRLQTQEALTAQIAESLQDGLDPKGVAIMIEAEHMCMSMRGIEKQGSTTMTTTFTGAFKNDPHEQVRFMTMLRAKDPA